MDNSISQITPVKPEERILSLDFLRGFAVLGILIMNIQSFSMIYAAYLNPTAFGDLTGTNKWIWILSHVFADQKFMTLFSILFGAGIFLFSKRLEEKNLKPAKYHYRRIFWLFAIGLIHAYLFWHGDILVSYSLCALLAYLFRKKSARVLILIAVFLIIIPSLIYFFFGLTMPYWPPEAIANNNQNWLPEIARIENELKMMRGSIAEQMEIRVPAAIFFQTFVFMIWTGWRTLGLMLIGMALFKIGIFTVEKSKKWYLWFMSIGMLVGFSLIISGLFYNFGHHWKMEYSMFLGWQYNYWGSIFVAFFYIGLLMLLLQKFPKAAWQGPLIAVGRMAFTNYLLMTLFCTTLFYGHGFGLIGSISRIGQSLIVVIIWLLLLSFSTFWLRKYRYGPIEWLWRVLTYWRFQPMKL